MTKYYKKHLSMLSVVVGSWLTVQKSKIFNICQFRRVATSIKNQRKNVAEMYQTESHTM